MAGLIRIAIGIQLITGSPGLLPTMHSRLTDVISGESAQEIRQASGHLPTTWSADPGKPINIKWKVAVGTYCTTRPLIAAGKIYVGSNNLSPENTALSAERGVLLCLRESDGKLLWQAVHKPIHPTFASDITRWGHCSVPAIDGNRLYYVSSSFELVCASTDGVVGGKSEGVHDEKQVGKSAAGVVWRVDLKQHFGIHPMPPATCTPLLIGETLFVVTGNGTNEGGWVPAPQAPSLIALDKRTGQLLWKRNDPSARQTGPRWENEADLQRASKLKDSGQTILHGQWSSPVHAIVKGQLQVIFASGDGWIRGYEPRTGELIWEFDGNPKDAIYRVGGAGTRNHYLATPTVKDDRLYIGMGQHAENGEGVGHLWCLDLDSTAEASPKASPGEKPQRSRTPRVAWHKGGIRVSIEEDFKTGLNFGRTVSACAIQDGLVYAADLGGMLYCLDAGTGKEYWRHDLGQQILSSPCLADGKIYLGNLDGQVHILRQGKKKQHLGTVEMDTPVRSTMVAANGVLYLATATHLFAIGEP